MKNISPREKSSGANDSRTQAQKEFFKNRLTKQYKRLSKWAKKNSITCYRLYDRDIPEIPLSVDIYDGCLYIALYKRPYKKDDGEEKQWIKEMSAAAGEALGVAGENIFLRLREKQKGGAQYEKNAARPAQRKAVRESGLTFFVDLASYIDTGLFLDHRPLRQMIREQSRGKRVLNLFSYTGSFSVYAAAGDAREVDSVDLSRTYLNWARDNFAANGLLPSARDRSYGFIQSDVREFLRAAKRQNRYWDIIILDPPTFSNSKRSENILDLNKDWPALVSDCLKLLAPGGVLYFSSNSRKIKFALSSLIDYDIYCGKITCGDISLSTIPDDFRNKRIHRCYALRKAEL